MIKAKITIYDDKRNIEFVKDKVITPVCNYRSSSLAKCYKFEFDLNVYEPFAEAIEQEEVTKDKKEETNGNS